MKNFTIALFIIVLSSLSLLAQGKTADTEFATFWKEFATAYSNTDHNWFESNSHILIFNSYKGAGEPEIYSKRDYIDNMPNEQNAKLLKRMLKLNLNKALNKVKIADSYLALEYENGPVYELLKLKGNEMHYSVLFETVAYSFVKINNEIKFLGYSFTENN